MKTSHFILHDNYGAKLNKLSMEERGQVITAIFAHRNGEELPTLSLASEILFEFIREQLDRDEQKYQEICEKRAQGGELGAEFGKLGGRPCKSYEEIMQDYNLSESIKYKVWAIIQGQQLNYEPIKNDKLRALLKRLDHCINDTAKINYLTMIQGKGEDLNK